MKTIQSKLAVIFIVRAIHELPLLRRFSMFKYVLSFSFALFSSFCFLLPSYAITEHEMGIVINLSGKQRMLTQKMSKEMFLIAKGIDVAQNKENLKKTVALFDKTLKGLIHGDEDLGLVMAENPKIVEQLEKVTKLWSEFSKSVNVVLGGDTSKTVLGKIAKENLPLLKNMNRAVRMFEEDAKKLGGKSLDPGMAATLNLSGKQRMLTQKMTKELLLVALDIDPDENKRNLKETTSLFERTLKGLLDGDKDLDLPGTKDSSIRDQLTKVGKLWNEYKPVLYEVIASASIDVPQEDLAKAAKLNLPLLKEMNKAVKMYEGSVK